MGRKQVVFLREWLDRISPVVICLLLCLGLHFQYLVFCIGIRLVVVIQQWHVEELVVGVSIDDDAGHDLTQLRPPFRKLDQLIARVVFEVVAKQFFEALATLNQLLSDL